MYSISTYCIYCSKVDAKITGNLLNRSSIAPHFYNRLIIFYRELLHSCNFGKLVAVLGWLSESINNSIKIVLRACSNLKVIRVNTNLVVALMHNKITIWYSSLVNQIRHPVSANQAASSTPLLHGSVSSGIGCSGPNPAPVCRLRFRHMGEKSLLQRFCFSILWVCHDWYYAGKHENRQEQTT